MNETVKAIRFYKTGRSDMLSVDRIQLSQLKENEVLVRVLAVAANWLQWELQRFNWRKPSVRKALM
jgi:NADPH:quinone reductase-like Zn-dependent oxidoreductase